MTDYDNANRGALFKNADKESEAHPDYKGQINVGGQEFWLSAWLKTSQKGVKYMSLSVKPKEGVARPARAAARGRDPDDDIPW